MVRAQKRWFMKICPPPVFPAANEPPKYYKIRGKINRY